MTVKADSLINAFKRVQEFSTRWWEITRVRRIDGIWHVTMSIK